MAIPGDPSVQDIILNGMKEGGQYTITAGSTAFTEFKNYQFETLKSELWAACHTDRLLETEAVVLSSVGKTTISLPTDFDSTIRLVVYDADDSFRGTLQSATSNTVTLASTFSSSPDRMYGRKLFTLSGLGAGQCLEIIGYDDLTKIATLSGNWTVTPDVTTGYMVATLEYELRRDDYRRRIVEAARPVAYGRFAGSIQIIPAPDKIYPILMLYRTNLTRLDDAGPVFVKHLRERRSLWIAGVKEKTMARYDDDRHQVSKAEWEAALMRYASDNVVYDTMEPNR
ncbi:MAG: hypothetical protein ACRCZI_06595 [Cetobacterium sp.]